MGIRINKIAMRSYLWLLVSGSCVLSACQKEIEVELPKLVTKIVVEGKIEPGIPPYVILTNNMPYFGAADITSIQKLFVHNAAITVSDGVNTVALTEYCSQSLPDSLLPLVAAFTGIDTFTLKNVNYCLYTNLNPVMFGQVGKSYYLT